MFSNLLNCCSFVDFYQSGHSLYFLQDSFRFWNDISFMKLQETHPINGRVGGKTYNVQTFQHIARIQDSHPLTISLGNSFKCWYAILFMRKQKTHPINIALWQQLTHFDIAKTSCCSMVQRFSSFDNIHIKFVPQIFGCRFIYEASKTHSIKVASSCQKHRAHTYQQGIVPELFHKPESHPFTLFLEYCASSNDVHL